MYIKNIIATLLFTVAAGQAQADGFYQDVVGQTKVGTQEVHGPASETTYSPLYLQVVGNSDRAAKFNEEATNSPSQITYTPLYAKVIGDMS